MTPLWTHAEPLAAYYNDNDPKIAAWLRELIKAGLIADGEVDERSITDVSAGDLRGFSQCHFFAGIGGWSYALRLAGWPDDRECWTGSCPCQPFSSAGKGDGGNDPRHLWPAWFRLIRECRPAIVFGEQVAAAIRHGWIDLVFDDLEACGYACGALSAGAHSVGAPHLRQRVWFVAGHTRRPDNGTGDLGDSTIRGQRIDRSAQRHAGHADESEPLDGLGHAEHDGSQGRLPGRPDEGTGARQGWSATGRAGADGRMADPDGRQPSDGGLQRSWRQYERPQNKAISERLANTERERERRNTRTVDRAQPETEGCESEFGSTPIHAEYGCANPWSDLVWIPCRDGKARPTQSGLFPLAHGVSGRVGRLRGYGNAIVPQVAAEVIRAYCEVVAERHTP